MSKTRKKPKVKLHLIKLKMDSYPTGRQGGGADSDPSKLLEHTRHIIKHAAINVLSVEHRTAMATYDARGSALTTKISQKIFSGDLYWYKRVDQEEKPQKTNAKIVDFYRKYNVKTELFMKGMECDLTHGWLYFVRMKGNPDPEKDFTFRIVFEPQIEETKYDEWGFPSSIKLKKRVKPDDLKTHEYVVEDEWITAENFQFISIRRPPGKLYGTSFLAPIWDDLVEYQRLDYGMSIICLQFGAVPILVLPEGTPKIDEILTDFEGHRFGTSLLCLEGPPDKIKFEFASAQGAIVDFPSVLHAKLIDICTGAGFPLRWFEGSAEGALSAASEDGLAAIQRLQELFKPWTMIIREFNRKFVEVDVEEQKDLEIGIRLKYRVSDLDMAQVEELQTATLFQKAQVAPLKLIYKELLPGESIPEELKEFQNFPIPLALKVLDAKIAEKFNVQLTQDEQEDQNAVNKAKEKLDSMSDYSIMQQFNMKNATVKKSRQLLAHVIDLVSRERALELIASPAIKMDSVVEDGEFYQIEGPLMIPDLPLQYYETNTVEVNPLDEVVKMVGRQRGEVFDLGLSDVLNQHDKETPKRNPAGKFKLTGLDRENRPHIVGIVPKSLAKKHGWLEQKLQKAIHENESIMLSAAYECVDRPSQREGVNYDHTNIKLHNAVICRSDGRAGEEASI